MLERLSRFLSAQGTSPRSPAVRICALIGGSFLFLVVVPLLLGLVGRLVAQSVRLPVSRASEIAIGAAVAGLGLLILDWAAWAFWRSGGGTPVPATAPQRLVVTGPYHYCRNPIELGAICYFFGVGCAILSLVAGLVMFLVGLVLGSAYHKFVEEPALLLRFGSDYEAYRRKTPFLIPRLWRRHGQG
jgi:protein-S-isoprenylcysteine O-methyltransferase Ste14